MVEKVNTGTTVNEADQSAHALIGRIWGWLENVCDPEVPVLSVLDLGIIRSIKVRMNGMAAISHIDDLPFQTQSSDAGKLPSDEASALVQIQITPTYTGCPAMNMIAANIKLELLSQGLANVEIVEVLSPAWTTDWMSESGKQKLLEYGIAPPQSKARMEKMLFSDIPVPCPLCRSKNTERISEFGSTACKALHRCLDCREPFDYFKCH